MQLFVRNYNKLHPSTPPSIQQTFIQISLVSWDTEVTTTYSRSALCIVHALYSIIVTRK